jgi:DNA-binding beta-propeller fold protein YncE
MSALLLATLLVLNKADATLAFVDPTNMEVVAKISTGNGPHEVAVTGDAKTAVVANYGTGPEPGATMSIVDVAARAERKRLKLPVLRPHGLYAVGQCVWFTAEGSRVAGSIVDDGVEAIFGTGAEVSHMIVTTPDQKKLYTANIGSDSVTMIDLSGAPRAVRLKQIAAVKGPEGIDLRGQELWVASRAPNGGIAIIDVASDTVKQTIATTTKSINRVKFTVDGKRVLVSDPPANEVLVYDAATREIVKRIATPEGPSGIVVVPDGKRAFVACAGAGKVVAIDLESLAVTGAVATGNVPDGMAWAP